MIDKHYRSYYEIDYDILRVLNSQSSVKITHIMYVSRLSHKQLKQHLTELKAHGYLRRDSISGEYEITLSGRDRLASLEIAMGALRA